MQKELLSIKEFAKRAGVSRRTIHRRIDDKKIKTKKYTITMTGIPLSELALWTKLKK